MKNFKINQKKDRTNTNCELGWLLKTGTESSICDGVVRYSIPADDKISRICGSLFRFGQPERSTFLRHPK